MELLRKLEERPALRLVAVKRSLENQRIAERVEPEPPWQLAIQWALIIAALIYFGHGLAEYFGYFRLRY